MSQLILEWLNQDVHLSKVVKIFEQDFANGYLFGELLHRHGVLGSFEEEFVNEGTLAAKRSNFEKLKAAFRGGSAGGLNVRLTDVQVDEIIAEDRGSSLRLLYQLRRGLNAKAIRPAAATQEAVRRHKMEVHGEMEEQFFDQKAKTLRPIDDNYRYELHAKKYVDEHTKQLNVAREQERTSLQNKERNVQTFRADRISKMQESRKNKELDRLAGELHWQGVQERKIKMLETDLVFEQEMIRRDRQRIVDIRNHYKGDCGYADLEEGMEANGIAWFERNLQRIGIDTSEHSGSNAPGIEAKSLKELHEKMTEKLPTKAQLQIESQKRMEKIREAKRGTDVARKERERRQRRVLVDQQSTTAAVEEKRMEDDLLAWLLQETTQSRQEASEYDLRLRQKEALWKQREDRQLRYAERAHQEQEEAWNRMAEEARDKRAAKLETARLKAAAGIVDDADVTKRVEEVSSDEEEGAVSVDMRRSSIGDHQRSRASLTNVGASQENLQDMLEASLEVASAEDLNSCVREPAIFEYLFSQGSWARHKPSVEEAQQTVQKALNMLGEGTNLEAAPRIGSVVQWLCKSSPNETAKAKLPSDLLPVVAITGSPAGLGQGRGSSVALGSVVSDRLAQEFGYAVLKPQEVIEECIALAKKPAQVPDYAILSRMRELGHEASRSVESGVSPYLVTEMIFRKIELLAAPAPKPVEEEDPADKKKKGKDKKGAVEEPEPIRPNGILVLGFPSDLSQHAAWESALRAYSSPVFQLLDSEHDQLARLSTVLAPYWREPGPAVPVVMHMKSSTDTSMQEPSVRLVKLCHSDDASHKEAIMTEATAEGAWEQAPTSVARVGEEAIPAPRCQGFEQELATATCPVDRAWLFASAQVLDRVFEAPLKSTVDVVAEEQDGEELVSAEEVCFKQVRELILSWKGSSPSADAGEVPAENEEEAAETEEAPGDQAGAGVEEATGVALDVEDSQGVSAVPANPEAFRDVWLSGLSSYLLGLRSLLAEVEDEAANYMSELVRMQRRFLEFLQRPDDKGQVIEQFLSSFPLKVNFTPGTRQADELNEQIQDMADKLWMHANFRREEAVEERQRLLTGGFWEHRANVCLKLVHRFQSLELSRFRTAAAVLRGSYRLESKDELDLQPLELPPENLSTLHELASWLDSSAERAAAAEPTAVPHSEAAAKLQGQDEFDEAAAHGDSSLAQNSAELRAAILAERLGLASRARAVAAWTFSRLEIMQKQYEEVFARMDEWIRHRVREENEAIKATTKLMRTGRWEDDESLGATLRSNTRKTLTARPSQATNFAALKRRRDVLKEVIPRTLDVEVYTPAKLEVCDNAQGNSRSTSRTSPGPPPASAGSAGSRQRKSVAGPDRWTQDLLWGLHHRLLDLGAAQGGGALGEEQLLQALLERRHAVLGFEQEEVAPLSWVRRPEEVYRLLCKSMVEPAWGSISVDVTDFMLAMIHHEYGLTWPSLETLQAARELVEVQDRDANDPPQYPDVGISEELFMQLQLWSSPSCPDDLRQFIFQVLVCFENEATPAVLTKPPSRRGEGSKTSGTVSARRLFTYLGLGVAPAEGYQRLSKLLLPASALQEATEEGPSPLRVQDLWALLFSCKSRPSQMVAHGPDLATFCQEILEEVKNAQPADAAAAKAKAKAAPKGKAKGEAEEAAEEPPTSPEEATVALAEPALLQLRTVLQALCSHGGLLCRRRGLESLFPLGGRSGPPVKTSSEASRLTVLQSLVPLPAEEPPPPEDMPDK